MSGRLLIKIIEKEWKGELTQTMPQMMALRRKEPAMRGTARRPSKIAAGVPGA